MQTFNQTVGYQSGLDTICTFECSIFGYRMIRATVNGPLMPKGSLLGVYLGNPVEYNLISSTLAGVNNTADWAAKPIEVPPGVDVNFVWHNALGKATVTMVSQAM